jgi:uncharacterized protein YjbI with pentapeptide repeats
MANKEHLAKLKEGVKAWNEWRNKNPEIIPDFKESDLTGFDLRGFDLSRANFGANDPLSQMIIGITWDKGSQLYGANLSGANLIQANLGGVDLQEADLIGADLSNANLRDANLIDADLTEAICVGTVFSELDLLELILAGLN